MIKRIIVILSLLCFFCLGCCGSTVEVSTDVVAAAGCLEFVTEEHARVVMARNTEDAPVERLQALAIYKEDAECCSY